MLVEQEMQGPLVTVGIPVYNDEKYVTAAVSDILSQSYTNLEIIISDNCSTDRSGEICKGLAENDRRVTYLRQSVNIGAVSNLEFLLRQANGKYFMWAASDDRWDPEFVGRMVQALEGNSDSILAFCRYAEIDEEGLSFSENLDLDFSGDSAFQRLLRFNLTTSGKRDAIFYGLYRRKDIDGLQMRRWWRPNRSIEMNMAFPILNYILAKGNYRLVVTDRPLWLKRTHLRSSWRHSTTFQFRPFMSFFAFGIRKFNQLWYTEREITRGSGSIPLAFAIFPLIALRLVVEWLVEAPKEFLREIRVVRKFKLWVDDWRRGL